MSGSMVAAPVRRPVSDFSGRLAVLATVDYGDGQHAIRTRDDGAGAAAMAVASVGGSLTTGGTAQNIVVTFTADSRYLIIQNPPDAASQGIATAENLFVSVGGAATVNGTGNYAVLAPGNSCSVGFTGLRPATTQTVSVIAATTGHIFLATHFSAGA